MIVLKILIAVPSIFAVLYLVLFVLHFLKSHFARNLMVRAESKAWTLKMLELFLKMCGAALFWFIVYLLVK